MNLLLTVRQLKGYSLQYNHNLQNIFLFHFLKQKLLILFFARHDIDNWIYFGFQLLLKETGSFSEITPDICTILWPIRESITRLIFNETANWSHYTHPLSPNEEVEFCKYLRNKENEDNPECIDEKWSQRESVRSRKQVRKVEFKQIPV